MSQKIHFVINPAAGQSYPILNTINQVCEKHKTKWSVSITNKDNFGRIVQEVRKNNAKIIAVYGGDGTIVQIAESLIGTNKLLGILPGGTANVLSKELNIPSDIKKACELICSSKYKIREIDAGQFGKRHFLLRFGFGFEAEAVKGADYTQKNYFGWLAYALSGIRALLKTRQTQYDLVIDGKKQQCKGLSLVIANSGNLGLKGVSLFPKIDISDGLLDVLLIRSADLKKIFELKKSSKSQKEALTLFQHWQAKKVSVKATPAQPLHYDGETIEKSKVDIQILPKAIKVITKK